MNENGEARYQGWEIYTTLGTLGFLVTQEAPPMLSAQFVGQGSLAIVVRGLANGVCRHDRHDRHNGRQKPGDRSVSDDRACAGRSRSLAFHPALT